MWRLWWKDTWPWFVLIKWAAASLANMAQHRMRRHAADVEAWLHLDPTNSDSRHQNWHHLHPECHLCNPVELSDLMLLKSKVCYPDMCIYILHFPVLNFSILMHMPRITSAIKIWFLICWLMKEHPLVSTPSAVWECSWHPFCRRQQSIERTCKWRRALIKRNRICARIIIYN